MIELKEFRGIWFLPSTPNVEIAGILNYEPGVLMNLELIGDLRNRTQFHEYFDESDPVSVIHGFTTVGIKMSLFGCRESFSVKDGAIPSVKYSCDSFIEGMYLEDREQPLFDRIECNFPQLLRWLGKSAFRMTREMVHAKFYNTNIHYSPDDKFFASYSLEEGFDLEFSVSAIARNSHYNCLVENLPSASIFHSNGALSLWELIKQMNILRSFLSLGLLQTVPFVYIKLYFAASDNNVSYTYLDRGEKYIAKDKSFLFNFSRIETHLPLLLRNWWKDTENIFPVRMHLLEAIVPKTSFRSTDFLVLTFAIEGFYHRFLKASKSSKGNLTSALKDILRIFKDLSFIKTISIKPDEVNDSRNYYAHLYSDEPQKKINSGVELLILSEKLKLLLILLILKQMGFENTDLEHCMSHSDLFSSIDTFNKMPKA